MGENDRTRMVGKVEKKNTTKQAVRCRGKTCERRTLEGVGSNQSGLEEGLEGSLVGAFG